MDQAATVSMTLAGSPLTAKEVIPPLVSIVIVNRNYAEFIGATIDSIIRQDYPFFECIIVDNASSDDSRDVIERHIRDDDRFLAVELAENAGLLGGALKVIDQLHGNFVVFVDSDDTLFPNFLSVHLQVHLSLPAHVGFTSSDIIEIDQNGRILTSGRTNFGAELQPREGGLRPNADALRLSTISDREYTTLSGRVVTVSKWQTDWVWAPGTANMYRKAFIDITRPDPQFCRGQAGCENHFVPFIHLIAGSAVIFKHLSTYRYHGRNVHGVSPPLHGVSTWRNVADARSRVQRRIVLRTITTSPDKFNWILLGNRFWQTIDLLAAVDGCSPRDYCADPDVQAIFLETFDALSSVFGSRGVLQELRRRMRFAAWRVFVAALRARRAPGTTLLGLLRVEGERFRLFFRNRLMKRRSSRKLRSAG